MILQLEFHLTNTTLLKYKNTFSFFVLEMCNAKGFLSLQLQPPATMHHVCILEIKVYYLDVAAFFVVSNSAQALPVLLGPFTAFIIASNFPLKYHISSMSSQFRHAGTIWIGPKNTAKNVVDQATKKAAMSKCDRGDNL